MIGNKRIKGIKLPNIIEAKNKKISTDGDKKEKILTCGETNFGELAEKIAI